MARIEIEEHTNNNQKFVLISVSRVNPNTTLEDLYKFLINMIKDTVKRPKYKDFGLMLRFYNRNLPIWIYTIVCDSLKPISNWISVYDPEIKKGFVIYPNLQFKLGSLIELSN